MTGQELRHGRESAKLPQLDAACKLRVSQPYLSLLEKGDRRVSARLARKAVTLYRLSAVGLPFTKEAASGKVFALPAQTVAEQLGALGYPAFSYLGSHRKRNPAEVLFSALAQRDLESRLAEALPWVVLQYPDLDWKWLVSVVKQHDLQNRLGFVTTFGVRIAERKGEMSKVSSLKQFVSLLERARLAKEDTLCQESLSEAERVWLRQHRPDDANHWNLLTDLKPEHVKYAA